MSLVKSDTVQAVDCFKMFTAFSNLACHDHLHKANEEWRKVPKLTPMHILWDKV